MIIAKSSPPARPLPPNRAGTDPQRPAHRSALVALVALPLGSLASLASLASCSTGNAQQQQPIALGMTNTIAPAYSDQQLTLYEVQTPVQLPIRKPSQAESSALGKSDLYPHAPFLVDNDIQVEINYTVTNLDSSKHDVELLLDPWNEFVRYRPGVMVISADETTPNLSGWDKILVVEGMSRVTGTLTPDDTQELAIDLATVEKILSIPVDPTNKTFDPNGLVNRAFNLQNRSNDGDPLLAPYIPTVVPGLAGFDLGLRTTEAANVAVEISIVITDLNGNRVVQPGDTSAKLPIPGKIIMVPGARL